MIFVLVISVRSRFKECPELDGVNGFIVAKRNPEAIAEKLKLLIEDRALCQKMGRESRRLYEEKFTEEKMVERLTAVFDQVMKN